MTVTGPKGFRAAGVAAGIKDSGALDLALVVNDGLESSINLATVNVTCDAHKPVALSGPGQIVRPGIGEVAGVDGWLGRGVRAGKLDASTGIRLQGDRADDEAVTGG